MLPAALAAERIGQDALAEYFAIEGEHFHLQHGIVAACRAVRARVLQRRGDRAGAVQLWQSAAAEVMEHRLPLYAIRLGQDCGGDEGDRIFEEGLAAMGEERGSFEGLSDLMGTGVFEISATGAPVMPEQRRHEREVQV